MGEWAPGSSPIPGTNSSPVLPHGYPYCCTEQSPTERTNLNRLLNSHSWYRSVPFILFGDVAAPLGKQTEDAVALTLALSAYMWMDGRTLAWYNWRLRYQGM